MAELADGRVYKRKRIKDPTDANNYIDIPVLYQANFKTMQEQAQESVLYFNNSSTSSRKIHTRRVTNPNDGSYVDVERIDEWYSKTAAEQAQERTHILKNIDPPPMQPDGGNDPSHEKTHIVRYYKNNAAGSQKTWVDVELIDELKIIDASSQYQEWIWYAKHPELDMPISDSSVPYAVTVGYCDPSFELAPLETSFDPPYRLDPLRNIINCKWSEEPTGTGGVIYIFWIRAWYESLAESHALTQWAWLQMEPDDPPYTLRGPWEVDYGLMGNVPFEDFDSSGFLGAIIGDSWVHYQPLVDAAAMDAALTGPPFSQEHPFYNRAVISFRIGEDWTA